LNSSTLQIIILLACVHSFLCVTWIEWRWTRIVLHWLALVLLMILLWWSQINFTHQSRLIHTVGYITILVQMLHFIMHAWMKRKQEREYKVSTKHEPALISKGKLENWDVTVVFNSTWRVITIRTEHCLFKEVSTVFD